jgi:hypothetical protein
MFKSIKGTRKAFVLSLFVFGWTAGLLLTASAKNLDGANQGQRQVVIQNLNQMPLAFTKNQGQLPEDVSFYVQGSDKTLYFTRRGVTFALTSTTGDKGTTRRWVVKLDFVGANPAVRAKGQDRQEAVISYFKGRPEDWKTNLSTYGQVVYPELWPGIDLVYSGSVNKLKYEFVVKPGADPNQIRLAYRGAAGVSVKETGQLAVTTPLASFGDAEPYAYQEIDGQRVEVPMAYELNGKTSGDVFEYGFDIGNYDPTRPLILDPAVLVYCGYIGGTGSDMGFAIAVDAEGNAYVTGGTNSTEASFPVVVGPDLTSNGSGDVFVAKVNANGTGLVYCGYIGGNDSEAGYGIAVDASGNAYVTGQVRSTQASFPVLNGPDLIYNGGDYDAFAAKVNASGTALTYCGYIGGTDLDWGYGIAVDASGNAYVTGFTKSTQASFPVVVGPDLSFNGGTEDAFVAKVNASGTALSYCGYIGGTDVDRGEGIAVDASGYAYVTGYTTSTEASFPEIVGPDLTQNGGSDAFVAKVNASGVNLLYCGFIGGSYDDYGEGIAVDVLGNAYVTGDVRSTEASFPVVAGPDLTHNGDDDAFVAKVNTSGTALVYCGYIGGTGSEIGEGIAVDHCGNAYVGGHTSSTEASFPVVNGPDSTYNGGTSDAFVAKVRMDGTALDYCGYIGGNDNDNGYGIAVDIGRDVYLAGWTWSTEPSFPVVVGPDLTHNGGTYDAFVAKITPGPPPVGYWRFNEGSGSTAYDATNNNNDGTITGATWTTGISRSALYFHGGGQWFDGDGVTVPHSSSLDINGEFTVEAWIKAKGSDNYLAIVDKYEYQDPLSKGFTLYLNNGRLRLSIYSASHGEGICIGISDLRDDDWHHVAGTLKNGYIRVYVDCQMEGEAAWTCPPASTTNNLGIGKRLSGHGGYMPFFGVIDEVRIYSSKAKCGDVNADGVINAADVVYLINYLFINGPAPIPLESGDVNCDGVRTSADVVYLINYLYIGGPAPCN